MMFDKHTNLRYKYGNRHFGAEGNYVSTVRLNQKVISEYIQNQLQEDRVANQLILFETVDPFTGEPNKRKWRSCFSTSLGKWCARKLFQWTFGSSRQERLIVTELR